MSAGPGVLRWVEVDLGAAAHNARWVKAQLGPEGRLMAVVKADAYGHGLVPLAKTFLAAGAERLGVRELAEADALRRAGIRAPIHQLAPILPEQAAEAARLGVICAVDSLAQARALDAAAGGRRLKVHVDLDFGLGRWGASPAELPRLMAGVGRLRRVSVEGLSAHIGYVPGKNAVEAEEKLAAFGRLADRWRRDVPGLVARAANSSVFLDFPHRRFDMANVGNLLYGINPSKNRPAEIRSPWSFKARVLSLREVRKGESVGYASEYLAPRRLRLAAVPVGYGDGLTMVPAERLIGLGRRESYWATHEGAKLPFVGRVGIVHVLLDATSAPRLRVGDTVTLPVRRTAARAPRVYVGEA